MAGENFQQVHTVQRFTFSALDAPYVRQRFTILRAPRGKLARLTLANIRRLDVFTHWPAINNGFQKLFFGLRKGDTERSFGGLSGFSFISTGDVVTTSGGVIQRNALEFDSNGLRINFTDAAFVNTNAISMSSTRNLEDRSQGTLRPPSNFPGGSAYLKFPIDLRDEESLELEMFVQDGFGNAFLPSVLAEFDFQAIIRDL